jgi:hypothetical protein
MRGATFIEKLALVTGLVGNVEAFWRMPCRERVGLARIDPLVNFGSISEHSHTIHGSNGMLHLSLMVVAWSRKTMVVDIDLRLTLISQQVLERALVLQNCWQETAHLVVCLKINRRIGLHLFTSKMHRLENSR